MVFSLPFSDLLKSIFISAIIRLWDMQLYWDADTFLLKLQPLAWGQTRNPSIWVSLQAVLACHSPAFVLTATFNFTQYRENYNWFSLPLHDWSLKWVLPSLFLGKTKIPYKIFGGCNKDRPVRRFWFQSHVGKHQKGCHYFVSPFYKHEMQIVVPLSWVFFIAFTIAHFFLLQFLLPSKLQTLKVYLH